MTKADRTEMKLLLQETMKPFVEMLNSHEQTLEDEHTGLKGRSQRHGERLNHLEDFKTEVKTKMGMIAAIVGAIAGAIAAVVAALVGRFL